MIESARWYERIVPTPRVTVYTKRNCPYCVQAKQLLARKGVAFQEIDAEGDDEVRAWLVERSGQRTVPQVFAGDRPLGGFADLAALDREGKLDALLRGQG